MKRIGNLYERIISMENLRLADRKAQRGKHSRSLTEHNLHAEEDLLRLHEILKRGEYHTSRYHTFQVHDPKERTIYSLPYYPDRIVHWAIMNVLEDVWTPLFTADTYSCIRGRGVHSMSRKISHALKNDPEGTRYCLKMDIRKFYPSIDHGVLKQLIRKKLKDARLLALLDEIIDSADGMPIGNYLSQFFANIMLAYLDHKIKEAYGVRYYYRYADDMAIFGPDKPSLHALRVAITGDLRKLRLAVKGNYQVFPVDKRPLDLCGYVFLRTHIRLRKRIKQRMIRTLIRGYPRVDTVARKASYNGWLDHCAGRHLKKKIETRTTQKQHSNESKIIRAA